MIGTRKLLNRSGVARIGSGGLQARVRGIARLDHGLESLAFVLDVSLGGFHQVRDQVVSPGELHIYLCERVLERIARGHQAVIRRDEDQHDPDDDEQNDPAHDNLLTRAPNATAMFTLLGAQIKSI